MALPASGEISIGDIKTELGSSSGSLRALSALASKSSPDAMSEFHGFSAIQTFQGSTDQGFIGACNAATNVQYWHSGSSTYPVENDIVYTNSSASATLANGLYKMANNKLIIISGGNGTAGEPLDC